MHTPQLYHGIYVPLARNAGYLAANPNIDHPFNNAENSWFYRYVAPYWKPIQVQLERSFDSGFAQTEQALSEIVDLIEAFMKSIGVSFRELEDGQGWIDFNTAFFDQLRIENKFGR